MSTSRVIWSSPQINSNRKIRHATQLNETSSQSMKFQIVLFLVILIEIYFNFFQKLLKVEKYSLILYKLTCKTLLAINLIFVLCYAFQIIQAKCILYIETNKNKFQSVFMMILSDFFPKLKVYYDKLVTSRYCSFLFSSVAAEEEKAKVRMLEERKRILCKPYFPAMHQHYMTNAENVIVRENEQFQAMAWNNRNSTNQIEYHQYLQYSPEMHEYETNKPVKSSTPFNKLKSGSITFGGDITPIHSPAGDAPFPDMSLGPIASQIKYRPATPSPPRQGSRYSANSIYPIKNQSGVMLEVPLTEVWKRLGMDCRMLDDWTFKLKQWIHATIIMRVVNEIDATNARLKQFGINDVVIGESNIQTLRHLANQPGNLFPTLSALIGFLDCNKDQAYVVNRLKELSQGRSLGKFKWDGGSSSVPHNWKEHLPNDTMLILHLFCTYIDIRYAMHSNLHGVRTFSQEFIIENVLNKDYNEFKEVFMLYQTSVQPPHFKVIFNQVIYDLPKGRSNLFVGLLVFLYKIKSGDTNFRWLNVGRSGMNINCIFEQ